MIILSLGSNIGNRLENLSRAIKLIEARCLSNVKYSIILETEAILPSNAEDESCNKPFFNMIICGQSHLSPHDLLHELKIIEKIMGRPEQYEKWSPRVIDIDILLYDNLELNSADLTLPHAELKNRPFFQHLMSLMGVAPPDFISPKINCFAKSYVLNPKFVAVVNITQDSFSDRGKFYDIDSAASHIRSLDGDGASIIEIGAQSTRPGAIIHEAEYEYSKLDALLRNIVPIVEERDLKISIDSFWPSNVRRLIKKYKIDMINDVKSDFDDESLKYIADSGCRICLMHSLSIPPNNVDIIDKSLNVLEQLQKWGEASLSRLTSLGFMRENIILDPGIGFGKDAYQSLEILSSIEILKNLGCQIMIGHSRKSYIRAFSTEKIPENRDLETIAISLAMGHKVGFLRVHNLRDHMRAAVAYNLIYS